MGDNDLLVRGLFHAALERPEPDREDWLGEACGDDAGLRREVAVLLEHHKEPLGFLDTIAHFTRRLETGANGSGPDEESTGGRIGRFRILRRLGTGGSATVYEAEQQRPCRTVALKVMRSGLESEKRLRRFEFEGEILARLQHPGIARLYEMGTVERNGVAQPYFAMELVDGRPVTEVAAELDRPARLRLFMQICAAVHYAHTRGVVHRDLKPQNVLVDSQGNPRILDFGIARFTDAEGRTLRDTERGELMGTLRYMSPEQADSEPDLGPSTDVYALGLLLFEILSGQHPRPLNGHPLHEMLRIVREDEPVALGTVDPSLRGDLETIVATALVRSPAERYPSAAELATDVDRVLRQEPIAARPPTRAHRARLFVRRNRGAVIGAAAAFLLLLIAVVGTGLGLWQALAQRNAARGAITFLDRILVSGHPMLVETPIRSVRQMLDHAGTHVAADLEDLPGLRAEIESRIGFMYLSLGDVAQAAAHLEEAQRVQEAFGAEPALRAMTLRWRGTANRRTDPETARRCFEDALALERARDPIDSRNLACTLLLLARAVQQADPPRARAYLDEVGILLDATPSPWPDVAFSRLWILGWIAVRRGDWDAARIYLHEALAMETVPEDGWLRSRARSLLAGVEWSEGRYADALPLFEGVSEYAQDRYGRNNAIYLNARGSVGVCLRDWGYLDRAAPILEDVLANWSMAVDDHSGLDNARVNVARLHLFAGRYEDAAHLASASLTGRATRGAMMPIDLAETYVLLAEIGVARERTGEALFWLDEADAIFREHLAPEHWRCAEAESVRRACELLDGHRDDALPRLVVAYERLREARGVSRVTYRAAKRVVEAYDAVGQVREAEAMRVELTRMAESLAPTN